jgi:hypothetical protein
MDLLAKEIKEGFLDVQTELQTKKTRKTFTNKQNDIFINPLKNFDLMNDTSTYDDSFEYDMEELANRKLNNKRNFVQINEEIVICKIPKPPKAFKKRNKYPDIETKIPRKFD